MRNMDRFRGCLIGGAVGDALGYAVEFMREREIFKRYGPGGITRYDLVNGCAQISDDTQMTLFTAAGLLYGQARGVLHQPGEESLSCIRQAYLEWYATQTRYYPLPADEKRISWLADRRELFARRAPGTTCMTALRQGGRGTLTHPINDSKGCGGVMRVAPIGLYFIDNEEWSVEEIDLLGARAAAVTHGHELGWLPAAALVHIVHALASGRQPDVLSAVEEAMDAMPKVFPKAGYMEDFLAIMEAAVAYSRQDMDDLTAIHSLGGGWVGEEALAIAVYCALKYPHDFEKAIIASVNHSGDSDSTGAVAGNILGAALGYDALPAFYLRDLELKDVILEVAEDLCTELPQQLRYCSVRLEAEERRLADRSDEPDDKQKE